LIFIDTGAFVARHVARDQHNGEAVKVWGHLGNSRERCLTSTFV
jgi:predicted nucleic acid-binding protein